MRNYKFNISITEKCNLRCPHCYTRNKEGSLTTDQVETIVGNLEDGITRLKIEGGEVYAERELFYHTIRAFRRRFGDRLEIRVNTNGVAFYKDRDTIIREADLLHALGVKRMRISLDKFHEDGGADLERVRAIKQVLDEIKHPLEVGYLSLTQALAIGNAEDLTEEQKEKRDCMNSPECADTPYLFTDIKGDLYACCWRLVPPMGNLLVSGLREIYAHLNDLQRIILTGDIKKLATTPELKRIRREKGECILCKEVFRNGK
jgi:uncharacterized radical SAM superfamily Fe-S cluster-containing enzyme